MQIKPARKIQGKVEVPSDKSISHRAALVGAIAEGRTRIRNFLKSDDTYATLHALERLGVKVERGGADDILIYGGGLFGLAPPRETIDAAESGTTIRLLAGLLAGQNFNCTISGKEGLLSRPMGRIIEPLRLMGADIKGAKRDGFAPLVVKGATLKPITYTLPVPSAQVKSSILLAGLYAQGKTCVAEHLKTRDHTERMLRLFGATVSQGRDRVCVEGNPRLVGQDISIPSDISSAAFFVVAALLVENSELIIKGVGLNPTRTGVLDILADMGADIKLENTTGSDFEPKGDIVAKTSELIATSIEGEQLPRAIDELPVLMVAACFAKGRTLIKGASELRVKETDRIRSMAANLAKMSANIKVADDDIIIEGTGRLSGASLSSFSDHRTAMSSIVAALASRGPSQIDGLECLNKSFPSFLSVLTSVVK